MPKDQAIENQLLDIERKHKEYEIQNETLDREIKDLLDYCKVTEQQLTTYVNSPEHFTKEQWSTLQEEKKRLDDALELKLSHIPNLAKKKKAQEERFVPPTWLFVR